MKARWETELVEGGKHHPMIVLEPDDTHRGLDLEAWFQGQTCTVSISRTESGELSRITIRPPKPQTAAT